MKSKKVKEKVEPGGGAGVGVAGDALGWWCTAAQPRAVAAAVNSKCTFHSQGNGLAKI